MFVDVDDDGFVSAWKVAWAFGIELVEVTDWVLALPASMRDLIQVDEDGEAIRVHESLLEIV